MGGRTRKPLYIAPVKDLDMKAVEDGRMPSLRFCAEPPDKPRTLTEHSIGLSWVVRYICLLHANICACSSLRTRTVQ